MHDPLSTQAPPREAAPHTYQIPVVRETAVHALRRANANVRQARYTHVHSGERGAGTVRCHLDAAVEDLRNIARAIGVEL